MCFAMSCISLAVGAAFADETDGAPPVPPSLRQLARRIEPDLKGSIERLPQYVHFFRTEVGNDPRLFAFDVDAQPQADGKVALNGFVEFPETRDSLTGYLTELGFEVDNQLQTLPVLELGDTSLGFLKTSHCLSYERPSGQVDRQGRRGVGTDCLYAEPLYLLRQEGDEMLVHSGEGYLGYIPADQIQRVTEAEFARYFDGSTVRLVANFKVSDDLTIPEGARLKLTKAGETAVVAELPTGEKIEIPAELCSVHPQPTDQIETIISNAAKLKGTKYVWGGRGSAGIDCSGLVQIAYATVGWHLPRDANQQYYLGRLTGTRSHTSAMRRGDTMYFLGDDGRIRHTAIYLGDGKYLNAELPHVRVGSMDPADENYNEQRQTSFAFAKRLVE
jgi:cell wall-associated NlpC family hydrolase